MGNERVEWASTLFLTLSAVPPIWTPSAWTVPKSIRSIQDGVKWLRWECHRFECGRICRKRASQLARELNFESRSAGTSRWRSCRYDNSAQVGRIVHPSRTSKKRATFMHSLFTPEIATIVIMIVWVAFWIWLDASRERLKPGISVWSSAVYRIPVL